jgi:hypothetical protein
MTAAKRHYTEARYEQFQDECEAAGMEVEHYRGRFFYDGPAVRTDEDGWPTLQDVIRATRVPLQWDNLAFDWIVYPR